MTVDKFIRWISTASSDEKSRIKATAEAKRLSDKQCISAVRAEPSWEARFCHALGVATESEKTARATVQQAKDQRRSLWLATVAIIIGVGALLVGIFK